MMGLVNRAKTRVTHSLHFTLHRKFPRVTKMVPGQVTALEEQRSRLSKGGQEQVVQLTLRGETSGPIHLYP